MDIVTIFVPSMVIIAVRQPTNRKEERMEKKRRTLNKKILKSWISSEEVEEAI